MRQPYDGALGFTRYSATTAAVAAADCCSLYVYVVLRFTRFKKNTRRRRGVERSLVIFAEYHDAVRGGGKLA